VFDRSIDAVAQAGVSPRTNVATDLRPSVSGYIQDPVGQYINDIGGPKLVQAVANPTGLAARTGVNTGTAFGLDPAAVLQGAGGAVRDIANDVRNTPGTIAGAASDVAGAANRAGGFIGSIVNDAARQRGVGSGANAATYAPAPLPTPSMTPDQILGMNTNAARPSSAQSDAIVQQMMAQANVQSPQRDFTSPQYDQSRGTVNQITGQLQSQASNNVADIQADAGQRDQSRNAVMDTANELGNISRERIGPITANNDGRSRLAATGSGIVEDLRRSAFNNVEDFASDKSRYDASTATSNDIIARLLAAAERPEGPSRAESLMLNAQERAVRNAYGDAGSLSGGWRSQLTGQRRALGQAATMQADIAAELGAVRADEENMFRERELAALGSAGGLAGDISGRDVSLAQSDADLLRLIRQGNQTNRTTAQGLAANANQGLLTDETGFVTSEADRQARIEQANQLNRLNAQLGAGNLQTGAMQSDTGLAQSNASLLAQIRQGNQANSLASLTAAGNNAGQVLRSDADIGVADANRRAQVDQNNRANSIAALQNAGVLSSTIRGQDVQLSIADQQALTSRINSAAQLSGSQFATQMDAALRQTDQNLRQQQFEFLKSQSPREWERWLAAAGSTAGLLGVLL
jgi:hypothetical protein